MKFFIDSADIDAIEKFTKSGMVDGVTTNPSIIAKSGRDFKDVIKEICSITPGPVSAEVTSTNPQGMIEEGLVLSKISKNVTVKVPLTWAGLEACKTLSDKKIMVNVTLSPSASVAVTVPIAVWFSSALKVSLEVKTGASLTLVTLTVIA